MEIKYINIGKNKTLKVIDKISRKNDEANKLLLKSRKIDKGLDNADLICTKTEGAIFNFRRFSLPLKNLLKTFIIMKLLQMKQ